MGDFEYALMYYHRGHKLRPELDEFRLGIQKAQEAIDNSIGSKLLCIIYLKRTLGSLFNPFKPRLFWLGKGQGRETL